MAFAFQIGQRWQSETEPELGLGLVQQFTHRTVTLLFPAIGERREYALENPPLRRVRFRPGDTIEGSEGMGFVVEAVSEHDGLLVYRAAGRELVESELKAEISLKSPQERLRNGQVDPSSAFDLRLESLQHQHRRRKSPVRGFAGARIELIPHQLYVAPEVAGRLVPRVLLADEVGLGKTIEACLIVHRWIQTGRARRVLVLVPEPLIHQWFVELLRRFQLWFHIFDEERCDAIETANPGANPFLDDQLVLCATSLLTGTEARAQQAVSAAWDMVVVDEAHHLGWAPHSASREYQVVEALAGRTSALLLLTGTPEQLGMASHFARLRLLDPDRYHNLDEFLQEAAQYQELAVVADKILNQQDLAPGDIQRLASVLHRDQAEIKARLKSIAKGDEAAREDLLEELIDRHGTGRVMFRNTRAVVTGFPKRVATLYPLQPGAQAAALHDRLADEFASDAAAGTGQKFVPDFKEDPRLTWLATLLRELKSEKVLLICTTPAKVIAIDEALRTLVNVKATLFHQKLPLVQRDRNAAWFAEEDGAQILIASEIGSEGRNFQFAHHLVLFDLPLNPELLEQRIGRLDRIGQKSEIRLHVPVVVGSSQEVLARWFHEGLDAFHANLRGGQELLDQFGRRVHDLAQDFHETQETSRLDLRQLLNDTRVVAQEVARRLERGRDRLLELNSFRPGPARRIIQAIQQADQDHSLERFMLSVFDHFNIQVEELAPATYRLGSAGVFVDSFPGLPAEGLTVTLDRQRALAREDIQFLTWDHPLATGALDLILGSELGTSCVAAWPQAPKPELYLEAVYLLESLAPSGLHVDRFLPPTPIRVVVDHDGNDAGCLPTLGMPPRQKAIASLNFAQKAAETERCLALLENPEVRDQLLPSLLRQAESLASRRVGALVIQARADMRAQLAHEISRLRELQKVNSNVTAAEIDLLVTEQRDLDQHLTAARLRLDAARLLIGG
jgi:ATP-dependent helicase HepA